MNIPTITRTPKVLAALAAAIATAIATAATTAGALPPEELPRPTYDNTFCYFPINEFSLKRGLNNPENLDYIVNDLRRVHGRTGLYTRLGFAMISNGDDSAAYELADKLGVGLVLQGGAIEHHNTEWDFHKLFKNPEQGDRRMVQWYQDGQYIDPTKKATDSNFLVRAVSSCYAKTVHEYRKERDSLRAAKIAAAMKKWPETILAVSGPIECEMQSGEAGARWGDYSPYSVTEFRDYLTHRGIYAPGAPRAGEGYPGAEVFADDPSPDQPHGGNRSFNDAFGTRFTTWDIRYWDTEKFPERLPLDASGLPAGGERGHIAGGFDAPRVPPGAKPLTPAIAAEGNELFWNTWYGMGGATPPFRQKLVNHWIADHTRWLREAGIPRERIFSHQIAGEGYGIGRLNAGASATWTAHTPDGSIGITTYFSVASDPKVFSGIVRLNPNWGIFEYHPNPIGSLNAPVETYLRSLGLCVRFRAHILTPIAWPVGSHKDPANFVVRAGPFAEAARITLAGLPDQPYYNRDYKDYAPPPVREIGVERARGGKVSIRWSPFIWEGLPHRWSDWREFTHFDVRDAAGSVIASTGEPFVEAPADAATGFTVVAVKKAAPPALPALHRLTVTRNRLRWDEHYNFYVDHYRVSLFPDAAAPAPLFTRQVRDGQFDLEPLAGRTEAWVEIAACDASGNSGQATPRQRVTLPVGANAAAAYVVNLVAVSKGNYNHVTLRWDTRDNQGRFWDADPQFAGYRIYRGATPDFDPVAARRIGESRRASFEDNAFDGSETWYRVTALMKSGAESAPSDALHYPPCPPPPPPPLTDPLIPHHEKHTTSAIPPSHRLLSPMARLHAGGAAHRHCHHRHSGRHPYPDRWKSPPERPQDAKCCQPEKHWRRALALCLGTQGHAPESQDDRGQILAG
jgi:hypothetical protein